MAVSLPGVLGAEPVLGAELLGLVLGDADGDEPDALPLAPPDVEGDAAGLDCRAFASLLQASKSAWVGFAARAVPTETSRPAAVMSAMRLFVCMSLLLG
jgi:hypothetical protein